MKNYVAVLLYYLGISWLLFHLSRIYYGKAHIRIVNYHSTPAQFNDSFKRQLSFYRKYYTNADLEDLSELLTTGEWSKRKPGLIISFDDGLLNNTESALPSMEEAGFTGWFCIPSEFHQIPAEDQYAYAMDHSINLVGIDPTSSPIAIGASDLHMLSKKHEIVGHTYTHKRMRAGFSASEIDREIIDSKNILENVIQKDVRCFCWVGGELTSYSKDANDVIRRNYDYSFQTNNLPITSTTSPYSLDRSNVETWFTFPLFLLTLSGFYDMFYTSKRKKVAQLLKSNRANTHSIG